MKKIAPNTFVSTKLPFSIKKYLDKNDPTINRVTVLTALSSYIDHLPHIEMFSDNNRTVETGVDSTCFGSWALKDAQDFILSILETGTISTPIVLCDNGPKAKKEITDAGNRTRTLRAWEDDEFRLPKKSVVKFKNKSYAVGGMTYSELSVKFKQLVTTRYEKATVIVHIEHGLNSKQKARSFLKHNKQKPVKNHEKLFVQPTELIRRLRKLSKHMPLFETMLVNGKRIPSYINLTDKNLEAPKNMLKLFAYMQAKHADERSVEDVKIPKNKLVALAQTCNLSTEKDRMAWQMMCDLVGEIRSIYDSAPTTKYDQHLCDKSQSDSTTSRYFNIMFVVLDNFEYLFGTGAAISNKKQFQAAMVEMFMTLDRDVVKGMDEAVFKRHTRKLFDPVPKGAPIKSRLQEVLYLIAQYLSNSSMTMFGIVYKDPNRCFPRALIDMKFAQQGFKCGVTQKSIPRSDAVGAHIIPHCKGGPTTYDNLIVVSTQVNRDMGDMTLNEYLEIKQTYSIQ
jgi:hypothetical protein